MYAGRNKIERSEYGGFYNLRIVQTRHSSAYLPRLSRVCDVHGEPATRKAESESPREGIEFGRRSRRSDAVSVKRNKGARFRADVAVLRCELMGFSR